MFLYYKILRDIEFKQQEYIYELHRSEILALLDASFGSYVDLDAIFDICKNVDNRDTVRELCFELLKIGDYIETEDSIKSLHAMAKDLNCGPYDLYLLIWVYELIVQQMAILDRFGSLDFEWGAFQEAFTTVSIWYSQDEDYYYDNFFAEKTLGSIHHLYPIILGFEIQQAIWLTEKEESDLMFILDCLNYNYTETGLITAIGDNVLLVSGLDNIIVGEIVLVSSPKTNQFLVGQALNLNADGTTGIVLFGDETLLVPSDIVFRTNKLLTVVTGIKYLGAVVNALGDIQISPDTRWNDFRMEFGFQDYLLFESLKLGDLDWNHSYDVMAAIICDVWQEEVGNVPIQVERLVDVKGHGIITRNQINRALYTGIKAIDALIPVGRGQRELIIGDRQTGKTTIGIDTILRQNSGKWLKNDSYYDVFSVYVAIGQKRSSVVQLHRMLDSYGKVFTTIIVAATASEPAALQYLAPYTGAAYGEHFSDNGRDALIVYDDLSKHAISYRQISLLLRRPPGREAYPGDVFYLHSRLLERSAQLNQRYGGGSLTAFPVIETLAGDVAAYIPTNVISITDGQIFLEAELFFKGVRPAINIGLSVSRIGSAAQIKAIKQVAGSLKLQLAQFRELEAFISFGGELDEITQSIINRGLRLVELLKQKPNLPYDVHSIIVTIYAGLHGFLDQVSLENVLKFEFDLLKRIEDNISLIEILQEDGQLTEISQVMLENMINDLLIKYL